MAKKTVKIPIPVNAPDEFIVVAKKTTKKHTEDGEASPLKDCKQVDMTKFSANVTLAAQLRSDGLDLINQGNSKIEQSNNILGFGKGQSIETPGTLYHDFRLILDYLLLVNNGSEEKIAEYGVKVHVGEAKTPVRKPKTGNK